MATRNGATRFNAFRDSVTFTESLLFFNQIRLLGFFFKHSELGETNHFAKSQMHAEFTQ